jgi:hypothetical protein
MTIRKTLISVVTAAAVVAGGSFAIAQTTGSQRPASESSAAGSPASQGTGSGMGNNAGQGMTGTGAMDGSRSGSGTGTGSTGQVDSMGRTGGQPARIDRN